jgi:DNA-binding PadR family transcriptional regulator
MRTRPPAEPTSDHHPEHPRRRSRGHDHDHGDRHGHGRGRLRHGEVRIALLRALADGPAHGYELGQRLEKASQGAWRPSPGSIYPTLQLLADEEMVSSEERDGKRIYTLTRRGQAEQKERAGRGEGAPWQGAYDERAGDLREAVVALKMAAKQVAAVGTTDQQSRAAAIVVEARRKLYDLLATA